MELNVFLPAARNDSCQPVTVNRLVSLVPLANRHLADWALMHGNEIIAEASLDSDLVLYIYADSWISPASLRRALRKINVLNESYAQTFKDARGEIIGWIGPKEKDVNNPSNMPEQVFQDDSSFRVRYPWDLLRANEMAVDTLEKTVIHGEVSSKAVIEGKAAVGAGSRLLPGVFIEGNVVIGENCKIGPNCYLRGNTSIGDNCHIGQAVEIKNSLIMNGTSVGHLSYCGDSILGENVNFGAGTITANLRHDGSNHRSKVSDSLMDTGRRKFGTVVGDKVHTGIHTSIYPGRKFWPSTMTRPGAVVDQDVRE